MGTNTMEHRSIDSLLEHVSADGPQLFGRELLDFNPLSQTATTQQIISNWNTSTIAYPRDKCLHQLFEEQALKTPHATALVFGDKEISYAALNEQANHLAHYLRSLGVKPEMPVPLCMSRSAEMIVGMLGILKSGGAYVPIDPAYPAERVAYMLEDTGATIALCNKEGKIRLEGFQSLELVVLDGEETYLQNLLSENLNTPLSSGNLAYIIYTSGSTGRPKGVMIEHRAVADHCYGVIEAAGLGACKSFALFSPLVFDAGHSIIHSAFILGASLHVLSDELVLNSDKLKAYFEHHPVDCIKIVPSLWLSYAGLNNLALSKKVMIFGGEAFHPGILSYLKKAGYQGNVYNHYGPTEVTIGKSIYKVDLGKSYSNVPIGKPFSNTRLYVLGEELQLMPAGVEGELYIAGEGLARGYLNQPALTAEKFIADPFAGGRMYKTGDKVRWLADGNLEYLGRADEQVKIQGHRIELGEIEEVLLQSELVSQAVVLANADKNGNKRLAGYIVPGEHYDKETLSAFLRTRLPEYMIPASWFEMDTLPLTYNGKINKRELENIEAKSENFETPKSETEINLAAIWRDLLKTESVNIHDNFFELGGNSVHAAVLFARIKKRFKKNLPLSTIFTAPTIFQLAEVLNASSQVLSSSSLVPIQPNGSKKPLFCIHAGGGNVVFYGNLSRHLGDDQPFYGLQAKGLNGTELPSTEMEPTASYYISEIRKVQPEGPYYLAGYCLGARIAFEMAQQLTREGQKVALLANFNGISPTYVRSATKAKKANETISEVVTGASVHLNHVAKLNLKDKVRYVPKKVLKKIFLTSKKSLFLLLGLYFESRYRASGVVFKLCIANKRHAPAIIARRYVDHSLFALQCKYRPQTYRGPMVIFRSAGKYTDPYLGWRNFVEGEIETFEVLGEHKTRRDIMNEPHVQLLAEQLKILLERRSEDVTT